MTDCAEAVGRSTRGMKDWLGDVPLRAKNECIEMIDKIQKKIATTRVRKWNDDCIDEVESVKWDDFRGFILVTGARRWPNAGTTTVHSASQRQRALRNHLLAMNFTVLKDG